MGTTAKNNFNKTKDIKKDELNAQSLRIIHYKLPDNQYYPSLTAKRQIFLHHTAGNGNPFSVIDGWLNEKDPKKTLRVATAYIIAGKKDKSDKYNDGDIIQAFDDRYYAYHLGLDDKLFLKYNVPYKDLNKSSIAIELCNYGILTKKNGKYYNWAGGIIKPEYVIEYKTPFRGSCYYERYTDMQIGSLKLLLLLLHDRHNIPVNNFNEKEWWDINEDALVGRPGIYPHVSVNDEKSDIHPQPEMVAMLNSLKSITS